jgi:membrane-bound lytic murein transglycosylase D
MLQVFAIAMLSAPALAGTATWPRPASLEPQIRFWRSVFTEWGEHHVVVHDSWHLDKVYVVIDLTPEAQRMGPIALEKVRKARTASEEERIRSMLMRFHRGAKPATADERRIYAMFDRERSPDRFRAAASDDRLRTQRGIKERFRRGIEHQRRYRDQMERIFREEGMPVELTRMPLIESCFDVNAYSHAGAAGIWQFMPSTGRRFMTVGDRVDERRDPLRSTRAAARFLRENYHMLGSWPLAITAYNHGPGGIKRAVAAVGSNDIGVIVQRYNGPAFGFASRNFYAEFLAALDVERDAEKHFGPIDVRPLPASTEIHLDRSLGIGVAARLARTSTAELVMLNPALMPSVVQGRHYIPSGYKLRLPPEGAAGFESRLASLEVETRVTRTARPSVRSTRPPSGRAHASRTHKVQRGQTLTAIARRYRVSVDSLRAANGLRNSSHIKAGQVLRIPSS